MNEVLTGINSVTEALMGRRKIKHIYILETRRDKRIDTITHLAEKKGVYVQYVNKQQLLQMSGKVNNLLT
jgi:tRNA G18 (ribose-2'-O)-methylase SpoU